MSRVLELIGTVARHEVGRLRVCELGVVKAVFGRGGGDDDHACSVELRDTGVVLPRVAIAVGACGAAALPAPGDLVVVVFAGGDVHAPVVVARLYHDGLAPPEHGPGQVVLRLPPGEDDPKARVDVVAEAPSAGDRRLEVTLDGDSPLSFRFGQGELVAKVGDVTFSLRQPGGSKGEAVVQAGDATITLNGSGDLTLETPGTLKLKGAQVEVQGDTTVKINGQTVELN